VQHFHSALELLFLLVTYARSTNSIRPHHRSGGTSRHVLDRCSLSRLSGLVDGDTGSTATTPTSLPGRSSFVTSCRTGTSAARGGGSEVTIDRDKLAAYQTLYEALSTVSG